MTVLNSFGEAAIFLAERQLHYAESLAIGLEKALLVAKRTAEKEIGHYQPAVGPFPAWPALAETTLYGWGAFPGKVDLGYAPPDNPLLREGELEHSFGVEVHGLEGAMGSTDPKMVYHEFGTEEMPARPVVGPAGFRNKDTFRILIGAAAVAGLIGGSRIHERLGYDFNTND